jgi:hypothetical protein
LVGTARANVEGQFRASLLWPRHQVVQYRNVIDERQAESRKVVSTVFGSGHDHDLHVRVEEQSPVYIGSCDPAFANSSESFDDLTPRPVLKVLSDGKLDRGWVRKVEGLPD